MPVAPELFLLLPALVGLAHARFGNDQDPIRFQQGGPVNLASRYEVSQELRCFQLGVLIRRQVKEGSMQIEHWHDA